MKFKFIQRKVEEIYICTNDISSEVTKEKK